MRSLFHPAGAGLIDTTRGALGHWLKIDNQLLILLPGHYAFRMESLIPLQ